MFSVYKITNLINDKCYIGSSINPERRWKQHIQNSKNLHCKNYNYPLYCAFRKYGLENFSFEIIKDDFDSAEEMASYEQEMIICYNSMNYGYNQTLYTKCSLFDPAIKEKYIEKLGQKCAKIDINGTIIEVYRSYQEAARLNNAENSASNIRRVCKGEASSFNGQFFRDLDSDGNIIEKPFKPYKARKSIVGIKISEPIVEVYATSISEASQKFKVSRTSLQQCIKGSTRYTTVGGYIWRLLDENGNIIENDLSIEDLIAQYESTHPLINGERKSISEWCEIYNISKTSVYKRMQKGMDIITAITKPKER